MIQDDTKKPREPFDTVVTPHDENECPLCGGDLRRGTHAKRLEDGSRVCSGTVHDREPAPYSTRSSRKHPPTGVERERHRLEGTYPEVWR